jgi:prepilin-type N-terminal cleavage/methylation domain-containing protein
MKKSKGFTLVEVIAASALLAAGVVVIAAITSRSLDTLRLNAEYSRAWEVLDRQLAIVGYIGIDTIVQKGITKGNITEGDTDYAWSVAITDELYDKLKRVDITVGWVKGGRVRSISASTMLDGSGTVNEQTTLPDEGETIDESSTDTGSGTGTSGGSQ